MPQYLAPNDIPALLRPSTRKGILAIHMISLAVAADKRQKFIDFFQSLPTNSKIVSEEPQYDDWKNREAERTELGQQIMLAMAEAAANHRPYEMSADDKQALQKANDRESAAKAAYYGCMQKCYTQAKGAKLIPEVPAEFAASPSKPETPKTSGTPLARVPTLGDGTFKSIQPGPADVTNGSQVGYLPPSAGEGSTIIGSVTDQDQTGPEGVVVGTVDSLGKRSFFKTVTDDTGHFAVLLPVGITAFELLKIGQNGTPTPIAHTNVGAAPAPAQSPVITNSSPVIEQGGANHGTVVLHTQGTAPLDTQAYIDGKPIAIRAASDSSVVAQLPTGTTPGPHNFSVASGGVESNSVRSDVASVTAEPIPVMHSGTVATVTLHIAGIPAQDNPSVHFTVSGAAKLAAGADSADVPVTNGIARVKIQGVHSGQVIVTYQLHASPGPTNPAPVSSLR